MGFKSKTCTVFEACTQKVAEARLPLKAIENELGLKFVVNKQTGEVTVNDNPVTFELMVQEPVFQGSTICNKIINIGFVWGVLAIKIDGIPLKNNGCIRVALVFQEEEAACGVRPGDILDELVVAREGTATGVVFESTGKLASASGKTFIFILKPRVEAVLIMKASFLVKKVVQRVINKPVRPCTPKELRPLCPPFCSSDCPDEDDDES